MVILGDGGWGLVAVDLGWGEIWMGKFGWGAMWIEWDDGYDEKTKDSRACHHSDRGRTRR